VQQSANPARSAVEQTDWHDEAERTFLHGVIRKIAAMAVLEKTRSLTIVAAPRALGMLRKAYPAELRPLVAAELIGDYVDLPLGDIETHLARRLMAA
jgi:protein required for attachment to host cells